MSNTWPLCNLLVPLVLAAPRVHPLIHGGAAARARQSIGPTPGKAATTGPLTTINGAG